MFESVRDAGLTVARDTDHVVTALARVLPHLTTLKRTTSRCGDAAVAGLNQALLATAVDAKRSKRELEVQVKSLHK